MPFWRLFPTRLYRQSYFAGIQLAMTDSRINEILDIVATETGVERGRLSREATLAELDIPSLDLAQTIFALEERFKVDIPVVTDRTGAEFTTVGDLVDHVLQTIDSSPVPT